MKETDQSKCTRCKESKPLSDFHKGSGRNGVHSHCKVCAREVNRAWRKSNPHRNYLLSLQHIHKYPQKQKARLVIKNALLRDDITRGACEICSTPKANAHHDDYSKPMEIRWLCAFHHAQWHKNNPPIT